MTYCSGNVEPIIQEFLNYEYMFGDASSVKKAEIFVHDKILDKGLLIESLQLDSLQGKNIGKKTTSYLTKKLPGQTLVSAAENPEIQKFYFDFKNGSSEATEEGDELAPSKKLKLDLGAKCNTDEKVVNKGERATVRISQFPPETTLKEVYEVVKPNMLDEVTAIRISNHN